MDTPVCCGQPVIIDEIIFRNVCHVCGLETPVIFHLEKPARPPPVYSRIDYLFQVSRKYGLYYTDQQTNIISAWFRRVEEAFVHVCPRTKKNFLNYRLVLYKLCGMLGLPRQPMPHMTAKNLAIWSDICEMNGWHDEPNALVNQVPYGESMTAQ